MTTKSFSLYYSCLIYPSPQFYNMLIHVFDCLCHLFYVALTILAPTFLSFYSPSPLSVSYLFFSLSILYMSSYYVIIFLRHFCQAAISVKISNLFICFCNFDLSCLILEKRLFYKNILYCLVFLSSILFF